VDFGKLLAMFKAYRAGAPLGDVVVMKLDALAAAPPGVAEKLRRLEQHAFTPDLTALRRLADGSLGREYARFLDANGIVPLIVSRALRERFRRDPYALRYTSTHDLHHVLAGFDTGLAGEAGVLAFNVGQGAAPVSRAMLRFTGLLFTLASPRQAGAIANNIRVGLEMGRKAELVMACPLEAHLGDPLSEVRRRLRIPDPREAGVRHSHRSLVTRLLVPRAGAAHSGR
jgi:ubiquinone biosynthesis protein Coq4